MSDNATELLTIINQGFPAACRCHDYADSGPRVVVPTELIGGFYDVIARLSADSRRLEAILSAKETRCYAYTWDETVLANGGLQSIPRRIATREELDEVLEAPGDE